MKRKKTNFHLLVNEFKALRPAVCINFADVKSELIKIWPAEVSKIVWTYAESYIWINFLTGNKMMVTFEDLSTVFLKLSIPPPSRVSKDIGRYAADPEFTPEQEASWGMALLQKPRWTQLLWVAGSLWLTRLERAPLPLERREGTKRQHSSQQQNQTQ